MLWAETGRVTLAKDLSLEQACQLPDVYMVGRPGPLKHRRKTLKHFWMLWPHVPKWGEWQAVGICPGGEKVAGHVLFAGSLVLRLPGPYMGCGCSSVLSHEL